MTMDDAGLDQALRSANPVEADALRTAGSSSRARGDHDRIVRAPTAPAALRRLSRMLPSVALALSIGALITALIIAVPSDSDPGSSAPSDGTVSAPPVPPPSRGAAVASAPTDGHSAAGISRLDRTGLPIAEVPEELLRGDYCQVYTDRVHRIAEIPSGGAVYLAWGPDDQVTWVTLGTAAGDGGGCSSGAEVRNRQAIVLAPGLGPTNAPADPPLPRYFVGFARDGYISAQLDDDPAGAPIDDNVFVIETARPRRVLSLTLRGPAGVHPVRIDYVGPVSSARPPVGPGGRPAPRG